MTADYGWRDQLEFDVDFGYLGQKTSAPRRYNPQIVLNSAENSVLRALRNEIRRCEGFTFSVAFVSPRAIALLKQELVEFTGRGRIVTSDYMGFNSPAAFAELLALQDLGIDVRIHDSKAFHPKGYVFDHGHTLTTMIGSSNLTHDALASNEEWNLKVSAARESDLAVQVERLLERQVAESAPLTQEWIDEYALTYKPPPGVLNTVSLGPEATRAAATVAHIGPPNLRPNDMQSEALKALRDLRDTGEQRAVVISATGTGKTLLAALDVRAVRPRRVLFLAHREQILDRTIKEFKSVLDLPEDAFGKLSGTSKDIDARLLFATVQSFSKPELLERFHPEAFDYVIIDEAHRSGAQSYRKIIEHLQPRFLLGLTATPERTDAFNVFELFNYNVPYEIRLKDALEADMLSPFHYYGITDATFDDGEVVTAESDLNRLISEDRVEHIITAIRNYGQAAVAPRGLIFCARTDEARALSAALNQKELRGRLLRTVSLSGQDSVDVREAAVERLERGELDYILTVDVFNEGVDIPSLNQIIMLRQTQSAIVFVQQLGRGLRKSPGKDYLVVIDFIGNYANNYLIPIALFGDNSLNKESLRKNLIAAEEIGFLPGLSSVRFDKIAQERVLNSIAKTSLSSTTRLRAAIHDMQQRLGDVPRLWDFLRFDSVDPVVLATQKAHYPQLLAALGIEENDLTAAEDRFLDLLSHEVLPAKRLHEFVLLSALLSQEELTPTEAMQVLLEAGVPATFDQVRSAMDTLAVRTFPSNLAKRYSQPVAQTLESGSYRIDSGFLMSYRTRPIFQAAVDDLIRTGQYLTFDRYERDQQFTRGRQYTRKDAVRLLCWDRKSSSTIYGYRTDVKSGQCPIFVTLHKPADVSTSTDYADHLIDTTSMQWETRSNRTLDSKEVAPIVDGRVALHVFVQKDQAEDFFYLGRADVEHAENAVMNDGSPVVRTLLRFREPIDAALFDYFNPLLTD